ncbi:dienelactone hydrolase family protein [Pseudoduganella violaceinigra]|uniref:dienelactone hydrolase family protein n=1 Tax=Pseudoduganella violaceinigra TaxID=246602 RepID=UPI00040B96EC|nr:dienelactone hydrolase family protein [Pseudoduganella violaceinigra]
MNDLQNDAMALIGQAGGVDRRDFIKAALGTGFAAAVMPAQAQHVISTDSKGLTARTVHIKSGSQTVPLYMAHPEGKTNLPVILVISEIFGVHEHIADVARRFAKAGYLALAPDLFVRHGDPSREPSIADLQKNIISKTLDSEVLADLDAVVEWARTYGADTVKLGITGFCWGGRITWMYSAHNPHVKAGVAWYGRVVGQATPAWPQHPIDIAARLKTPVLGLYGAQDTGIPVESVEKMKAALAQAHNQSEFRIFEHSGHAFFADYRPSYNAADAAEGWQLALGWFKSHGVA